MSKMHLRRAKWPRRQKWKMKLRRRNGDEEDIDFWEEFQDYEFKRVRQKWEIESVRKWICFFSVLFLFSLNNLAWAKVTINILITLVSTYAKCNKILCCIYFVSSFSTQYHFVTYFFIASTLYPHSRH